MIRRIKLWWYGECRAGALIDEMIYRTRMEKAEKRLAYYEERIRALTVTGDNSV